MHVSLHVCCWSSAPAGGVGAVGLALGWGRSCTAVCLVLLMSWCQGRSRSRQSCSRLQQQNLAVRCSQLQSKQAGKRNHFASASRRNPF